MSNKIKFFKRINIRILTALLLLFSIVALCVNLLNYYNLRAIYEDSFTEKVLLSNNLMASLIDGDDVKHYVELMSDQDEAFKKQQKEFNENRDYLLELQDSGASQQEQDVVIAKMQAFHDKMDRFKTDDYKRTLEGIKKLKAAGSAKYVYVYADTGVRDDDGSILYTYIFDAEDDGEFDSVDSDGLGTVSVFEPIAEEIYITKKPMKQVYYYNDKPYGELYFAYAPILDSDNNVIAIIGTDIDLGEMNQKIRSSMLLNCAIFLGFIFASALFIYVFLNQFLMKPLAVLTNTALKLAGGDVYASVPSSALKKKDELGWLAHSIDEMSSVYQNMIKSTGQLFEAANIGRLEVRNDASKYKGDVAKVIQQINDTLDATTLYLNSVPEGIFIMSKEFDMLFRNKQYITLFGDMSVIDFVRRIVPDGDTFSEEELHQQFQKVLEEQTYETTVWMEDLCFSVMLVEMDINNRGENSVMVIAIDITALIKEKENAQSAAKAKSDFLSRMSHEMRTPMNAIIGMTKIADNTEDISKLKYCISTIEASSEHLLGIINDVLDMSKIEAGKFDLEVAPMNVEKMLMKICNLIIDKTEQKNQKLSIIMGKDMGLTYIADELRLSQVITNILSNAVKFTPENGAITLTVDEKEKHGENSLLHFSVKDTGIGMTQEQIDRLFTSFEQADGSISRRFGGTGLGLAITKNLVEKMDGRVWAESEYGKGSVFSFEVTLPRVPHDSTVIFDGIRPADIKLLIIESDQEVREHFVSITNSFGILSDHADNLEMAISATEAAFRAGMPYDIIFLDNDMPEMSGIEAVRQLNSWINKNTVIIMTSFLEWHKIEDDANQLGIKHFIPKPLFPSSILDTINNVIGNTLKYLEIKQDQVKVTPDFSEVTILLAEDVEINREIFIALLEDTQINIEVAENGAIAVDKFASEPNKFDLIIMDIQMPEMDGYEATKVIRAMETPRAKTIPIIAMTANAFREDIDQCIACGMNAHLAKPIDENAVIKKIEEYVLLK